VIDPSHASVAQLSHCLRFYIERIAVASIWPACQKLLHAGLFDGESAAMNRAEKRRLQKKAAKTANKGNIPQIFGEAVKLHQAGDINGAARLYDRVLELDPLHVDALSNRGLAVLKMRCLPSKPRYLLPRMLLTYILIWERRWTSCGVTKMPQQPMKTAFD
jgi:dihydrodipicolinate synthase/N-acetylneuraminate lyase